MAWTLPVLIAGSVAAAVGIPLWLLHRQRRRLTALAEDRRRQDASRHDAAKRALEELREGLADGLLVVEFATLLLVESNQALSDLLGRRREDLIGASLETLIAPQARPVVLAALRKLQESQTYFHPATPCLGGGGFLASLDLGARRTRIAGQDRLLLSLRAAVAPTRPERDPGQDPAAYRSLVEATFDGYFIADLTSGRFLHLNPALRAKLALPAEGGPSLGIWDVLAPEDHPRARQRQAELRRADPDHPRTRPMTYTVLRADGTKRILEVSSGLTTFQGRPALQGLVRDISERESLRAQLQQAQKLQSVGALTGGVAHEFNNLMMALGGYLQLLREKLDGRDDALVYVDKMDRACRRAGGLTRQVLSLARPRADRRQPVEVNQVVREVRDLLSQTLPPTIELVCDLAPDLPPVLADPGQIQQVLLNLGLNARDALPQGGRIGFATRLAGGPRADSEGQSPRVVLEVSDDGEGMAAEVRERIFEPFFTTKAAGRGTGLGLAVVQSLVRGLDGGITVASRPGMGSRFSIDLPACPLTASPTSARGERPAQGDQARHARGRLVLTLVPDLAAREALRGFLESQGCQARPAGDHREALALLDLLRGQGRSPDLALLDLTQPETDGQGLLLRLADDQTRFPILLIGGQGLELPPRLAPRVRVAPDGILEIPRLLEWVRLALAMDALGPDPARPS